MSLLQAQRLLPGKALTAVHQLLACTALLSSLCTPHILQLLLAPGLGAELHCVLLRGGKNGMLTLIAMVLTRLIFCRVFKSCLLALSNPPFLEQLGIRRQARRRGSS